MATSGAPGGQLERAASRLSNGRSRHMEHGSRARGFSFGVLLARSRSQRVHRPQRPRVVQGLGRRTTSAPPKDTLQKEVAMRFGKLAIVVIAWALEFAWVSSSLGGVADSPLPALTSGGPTTLSAFIVPGVMRFGNLETEFTCTSLSAASFKFAVQVFSSDPLATNAGGPINDVTTGNGVATLAPGATQTIATGGTAGLHEDVVISGLGSVKNGSARIVSESKAIACTAYVADRYGAKRCGFGSTTNLGGLCTLESDCGCTTGSNCCRTVPDSMLELKLIVKRKQKGA